MDYNAPFPDESPNMRPQIRSGLVTSCNYSIDEDFFGALVHFTASCGSTPNRQEKRGLNPCRRHRRHLTPADPSPISPSHLGSSAK